MTGAELKKTAIKRWGEREYRKQLASHLGKTRYTIWRYFKMKEVPRIVEVAIRPAHPTT